MEKKRKFPPGTELGAGCNSIAGTCNYCFQAEARRERTGGECREVELCGRADIPSHKNSEAGSSTASAGSVQLVWSTCPKPGSTWDKYLKDNTPRGLVQVASEESCSHPIPTQPSSLGHTQCVPGLSRQVTVSPYPPPQPLEAMCSCW